MKNKYIMGFLLISFASVMFYLVSQYLEYSNRKSDKSFETYNMLTIAIQSVSYYNESWQKSGVDGLISQLNDYSKENRIDYFRNVLSYLEKNKKDLHGIVVQDSNAFIVYTDGPDGRNDSLRKGYFDYSSIEFTDYILKRDGDLIVTYFLDFKE